MRDTLWVEDVMWALRVRKTRKEFDKWEVNEHRKEVSSSALLTDEFQQGQQQILLQQNCVSIKFGCVRVVYINSR